MPDSVDAMLALHHVHSLLHTSVKQCSTDRCERDFLLNTVMPTAHRILTDYGFLTIHQLEKQIELVELTQKALESLPYCPKFCPPLPVPDTTLEWVAAKDPLQQPKLVAHVGVQTDLTADQVLTTDEAIRGLKHHQLLPDDFVCLSDVNPYPLGYPTDSADASAFAYADMDDDFFDDEEEEEEEDDGPGSPLASHTVVPSPAKPTLTRRGSAIVDISSLLLNIASATTSRATTPVAPSPAGPTRIKLIVKDDSPDLHLTPQKSSVGPIRTAKKQQAKTSTAKLYDRVEDVPADGDGKPLVPCWQVVYAVLKELGGSGSLGSIWSAGCRRFPFVSFPFVWNRADHMP